MPEASTIEKQPIRSLSMPPRWSRQPDRRDPAYRRLADRMNFAVHVAAFAATNSGLWFFQLVEAQQWPWTVWITGGWTLVLLTHGVYIFAIADYRDPNQLTTAVKHKT